jgi:hypothetical protein
MKKLIIVLLLLSFAIPVYGIDPDGGRIDRNR